MGSSGGSQATTVRIGQGHRGGVPDSDGLRMTAFGVPRLGKAHGQESTVRGYPLHHGSKPRHAPPGQPGVREKAPRGGERCQEPFLSNDPDTFLLMAIPQIRSLAMEAGLTNHIWTLRELLETA